MRQRWRLLWALPAVILLCRPAEAQVSGQLWGNVTIDWAKSDRRTYGLDLEPQVLVVIPPGQPGWWEMKVTPSAGHAALNWLDLTGELVTAYTHQTDDENSVEVAPRAGARIHLFSRDLPTVVREREFRRELPPRRRIVLRDWMRVEWRNFFYNTGKPGSSNWRFRNRLEFEFPLNRRKSSDDGAWCIASDWEWFIPLGDPSERYANKQRIRAGFAWRRDFRFRLETLYVWNLSRDSSGEGFTTSQQAIDVRVRWVF